MRYFVLWFLFLFSSYSYPLSTLTEKSVEVSNIGKFNLALHTRILFDKEERHAEEIYETIISEPLNSSSVIRAPYQSGDIWLMSSLKNSSAQAKLLYLELSPVFVKHYEVFLRHNSGKLKSTQLKYTYPRVGEQIITRRPTIQFSLPAASTTELLIYYKPYTRNKRDLVFSLDLFSLEQFQYNHIVNLALLSALFGGLVLAAFFCGVAYFQIGLHSYLYLQFFIVSVLTTLFCFEGLVHYYPTAFNPVNIFMVGKISSYVMGIFLIQLGRVLIFDQFSRSRLNQVLKWFVICLWFGLIPVYLGHARFIFDLTILALMATLVVVGLITAYRQRKYHLFFFAAGMGIQLLSLLSFSLLDNLSSSITSSLGPAINILQFKRVVFHVGTLLNILFIAISINVQVRKIKDQRDFARKQEQQLQNNYRRELEATVALRTQEIEQQTLALKSLDAAKSKFFASVSHEFRTPITLISGPATLLLNGEYGQLSEPAKEQLNFISRNSQRLKLFVDQILDLAKFEAHKFELQLEAVELSQWLSEQVAAFETLVQSQGKFLVLDCRQNALVRLDPFQFEKVINNLITNALKFSEPNSCIYIETGVSDRGLYIAIRDEGQGMSEDTQQHCFDMFYKATEGTSNVEGCGIGLALTKDIVELHGATIEVQSELGSGSCFRLLIQALVEEQFDNIAIVNMMNKATTVGADNAASSPAADSATLLIVEDNQDMMRFICSGLSQQYRVLSANNGKQGLELIRERAPDIVVTDLSMPIMDGLELLSAIRADSSICDIPVVLLTGAASTKDQRAAYASLADDYLTKPFDMEDLRLRLDSILRIRSLLKSKGMLSEEKHPPTNEPDFVVKARALVAANISDSSFDSDELASQLFMTSKTFGRKLDKAIGMSPGLFIRTIRLEAARQLIVEKNYTTKKHLAQTVGFSSAAYFTRLMRSHFTELTDF